MARPIGPTFEIEAASDTLRRLERELRGGSAALRKGAVRALKKSLRAGRTAASQDIRAVINLKKKPVDARIKSRVISERGLTGSVAVRDKRLELVTFMTKAQIATAWRRQNARRRRSPGVAAKVYKKKPRAVYAGTFVNIGTKTGRWHVFERTGPAQYPIRIKYGPRLTAEFEKNLGRFAARANAVLQKNLDHELAFALGRL